MNKSSLCNEFHKLSVLETKIKTKAQRQLDAIASKKETIKDNLKMLEQQEKDKKIETGKWYNIDGRLFLAIETEDGYVHGALFISTEKRVALESCFYNDEYLAQFDQCPPPKLSNILIKVEQMFTKFTGGVNEQKATTGSLVDRKTIRRKPIKRSAVRPKA